jgi:glucosylceramidase
VWSEKRGDTVEAAAFVNPDGSRVAIVHRKSGQGLVTIALDGERYAIAIPSGAIATVRWSARSGGK